MHSNAIDSSILKKVLSHYDFFDGKLDHFAPIPQRLVNQNAKFSAGGVDYVVKRYDKAGLPSCLELSHKVQIHLQGLQFPVAKLEVCRDGNSLVEEGGGVFSIQRWVDGQHLEYLEPDAATPDNLIEEIARRLGQYHSIVQHEFSAPSDLRQQTGQLIQETRTSIRSLTKFKINRLSPYLKLKMRWKKTAFERDLLQLYPLALSLVDSLPDPDNFDVQGFGDVVIAHNDINWQNFIFDSNGKLVALIDFDNMQYAYREIEVGFAALVVVGANPEKLNSFVSIYAECAECPLDLQAVHLAMKIRCIRSFRWALQSYVNDRIEDVELLEGWIRHLRVCAGYLQGLGR